MQSKAYGTLLRSMLSHELKEVTVKSQHKNTTSIFLDCRNLEEFNISHLKDAAWVGYDDFTLERVDELEKETPITVYCSIGYRSEKIGIQLKDAGFTDITNLYGGIFEWKNQGYAVYDSIGETEKVHGFDKKWGIWLTEGEKVY